MMPDGQAEAWHELPREGVRMVFHVILELAVGRSSGVTWAFWDGLDGEGAKIVRGHGGMILAVVVTDRQKAFAYIERWRARLVMDTIVWGGP